MEKPNHRLLQDKEKGEPFYPFHLSLFFKKTKQELEYDNNDRQIKDLLKDHSIQHGRQALHNIGRHQHINMLFQMPFGILQREGGRDSHERGSALMRILQSTFKGHFRILN